MRTANGYAPPKARQMSVWLSIEDIKYAEAVGQDKGVSRNAAFALMIAEHRKRAETRAKRHAGAQ